MSRKFFKSYEKYKKEHIKENVMSLANTSEVQNFEDSDKNLEDIKENEEEVENTDNTEECTTCQDHSGLGTEEEKKVELPAESTIPVIGHIAIATEIELPISEPETTETLPISEPIINSFNPNMDNTVNTTPVNMDMDSPKTFSIVKIMTQNGEKIGMCYTDDVAEYGIPLHNNIDFNTCCELIKKCCSEHCIDEFKSDTDNIVGAIPSFMIPKKKSIGTSYKPN